jgi:hypothetical protein
VRLTQGLRSGISRIDIKTMLGFMARGSFGPKMKAHRHQIG